jgi:hypothetical protein
MYFVVSFLYILISIEVVVYDFFSFFEEIKKMCMTILVFFLGRKNMKLKKIPCKLIVLIKINEIILFFSIRSITFLIDT